MEKQILKNEKRHERRQILIDSCVKTESFTYSKQFSKDEMLVKKDELTQQDIKLDKLEVEKKELTTTFNQKIKVLKNERNSSLTYVRTGQEEVTEDVYLLDDQERAIMGYYNESGYLVYSRPLMPEEKQLRIITSLAQ